MPRPIKYFKPIRLCSKKSCWGTAWGTALVGWVLGAWALCGGRIPYFPLEEWWHWVVFLVLAIPAMLVLLTLGAAWIGPMTTWADHFTSDLWDLAEKRFPGNPERAVRILTALQIAVFLPWIVALWILMPEKAS